MATAAFSDAFSLPVAEHCGPFGGQGLWGCTQVPRVVLQGLVVPSCPWCCGKGQVLLPGCDNLGVSGVPVGADGKGQSQLPPACPWLSHVPQRPWSHQLFVGAAVTPHT